MMCFLWVLSPLFSANANPNIEPFIQYKHPHILLQNVTLIDGTGQAPKPHQNILIDDGIITAITQYTPNEITTADRQVIDGTGKSVIPGLVMMHEHMFYPTGRGHYTEMLYSFPRLYLAGGATTIRTAGTTAPYADLNLRAAINAGKTLGPDIDVTAPYLNGPGLPILKINSVDGVEDIKAMMNYWIREGVTSYKAYMHISRAELKQAIQQAHANNQKVTAHLCSVTYQEAAELGIDNLEHGFFAATDFVKDKKPDTCPKNAHQSLVDLDINSPEVDALINILIKEDVTLTSTLTVFETYTKGRPKAYPQALEALTPHLRQHYEKRWQKIAAQKKTTWPIVFKKMMQLEKKFVEAGGKLIAGTDPTGYGGVIAGFSNQRMVELLVEAGFSIEHAIQISTLNAAKYLERDKQIGSINIGKRADLVLISGDISQHVAAIRDIETVFKQGIGYRSSALINSAKGVVGIY